MKKILFILVIISFWGASFSQNTHYQYWLPNYLNENSAVTIVHSSGIAYLIQTGPYYIHVSDIDPTNMQPLGNTASYNLGNYSTIYLYDGYEDFQGNLIAYGKADNNYIIIKINLNNWNLTYNSDQGEEIIKGCCGYDVNGNICNLFLINNVNHEVIALNENLDIITTWSLKSRYAGSIITDISWDLYHNIFIASGSYSYNSPTGRTDPFLMFFRCGNGYSNFFDVIDQFRISNNQQFQRAEGRTLHEIIDTNHLILCQDLRDTITDYLWLTLFDNYLTHSIDTSKIFGFYSPKLVVQDMKFDSNSNKLTILGRNVFCDDGINYIAQFDTLNLSNIGIAQIMDQNYNSICSIPPSSIYMYGNLIYLQRLELNPFNSCNTILSTGIISNKIGSTPYITETLDISHSHCDDNIHLSDHPIIPSDSIFAHDYLSFSYTYAQPPIPYSNLDSLLNTIPCNDLINCNKGDYYIPQINKPIKTDIPMISLFSCDFFQCDYFSEELNYYLYDIAGKIIYQGVTENGIKTTLPNLTNGIYILFVIDNKGNKKTEKLIYFK